MRPAPALGGMRFFKPEVQRIINVVVIGTVVGAFALPVAWGYRQRQEARTWHETACAYRLREAVRRTNFMLAVKNGEEACATLARLGLDVAAP
jgi:hypothetical protein